MLESWHGGYAELYVNSLLESVVVPCYQIMYFQQIYDIHTN